VDGGGADLQVEDVVAAAESKCLAQTIKLRDVPTGFCDD
jgi:hypothetical protein